MKVPLGVSPINGNQGTTRSKEKILLTSVAIEPTTSGLDLPFLCRLSCEVGQRKSGTIMVVNRGEEKAKGTFVFIVLRGKVSQSKNPKLGIFITHERPPSGSFMASHSTLIYTSELILCSTICVHSATRHNIHMYPYFLFAAIHHLNRPRLSLSDLVAQSAE